jgi:hypothetical protein
VNPVDRRRTPRAPCDLPALWRRGRRTVNARIRDLNEHGLFLETPEVADLGYVVDLSITLPVGPIEVLGVARFVGVTRYGHGIGVAVYALSRDHRRHWEDFYRTALADLRSKLPVEVARHFAPRSLR